MIKLLIFSLLFISCDSKLEILCNSDIKGICSPEIKYSYEPTVEYKDFPREVNNSTIGTFEQLSFNPQIEMMIVFLWPKELNQSNEKEVIEIITRSRKISEDKEKYLKNLNVLNSQYSVKNCDCHTYGICDDDMDMDVDIMVECEEISDKQAENDLILANLTLDHEYIKEKLNSIGASNIDVGVDDDVLDIGEYDFKTKTLKLKKFGYQGQESSVSFQISPYNSQNMKAEFNFTQNGEVFTGDLGISNKQYNVIFSGEIETGSGQRGLIYWEHLK